MKRLLTIMLLLAASAAAQTHRFTIEQGRFVLDGKPFQVLSGEMHYTRVPREYWRDRLKKARAMGLNTITTYVFWDLHEPRPGVWDFQGQLDVAEFAREAQQEGLWVILRPGPYVCSEWDLGGLPSWLLADPNMQLRSQDPAFLRPAAAYLKRLGQELAPLTAARGGPIIMVQVENEYGSFADDKDYMRAVRDAIVAAGFDDVVLEAADGPWNWPKGTLPDLPVVANFPPGRAPEAFAALDKFRPGNPHMAGEWWAGWFDQWGEPHHRTDAEKEARDMEWMLANGASFSIYMWHGGTTFGFMNGANWEDKQGYRPQTTSYDYDAALDEAGRITKKYEMFRQVIARHAAQPLPEPPAPQPIIEVPAFELRQRSPLWDNLPKPVLSETPRTMEAVGQRYGYIAYRTRLPRGSGELVVDEPRDYAQVYVDGALAGTLDRRLQQTKLNVACAKAACELTILVENTGRINFGDKLRDDRKGITRSVSFGGKELRDWRTYPLPMDDVQRVFEQHGSGTRATAGGPAFYRGTFTLSAPGDTFLDTRGWGKGEVWVNGHNLGRFWSIGPQQTLYVPGPWLKKGANEVVVFALTEPKQRALRGLKEPVLDQLE
jgi:beta-galactosidase